MGASQAPIVSPNLVSEVSVEELRKRELEVENLETEMRRLDAIFEEMHAMRILENNALEKENKKRLTR